jgi:hypothetical protein
LLLSSLYHCPHYRRCCLVSASLSVIVTDDSLPLSSLHCQHHHHHIIFPAIATALSQHHCHHGHRIVFVIF